jgi:hypothetical protein|tara:strand:+ start:1182 stop:2408 length:1227 start_codon:yes stop_codon:yes gene_type:complete
MSYLIKEEVWKKIDYKPHPKQELIHQSGARFRALCTGRRFGKSVLASREAIYNILIDGKRGWIVAPNYELTKKVFREVIIILNKVFPALIERQSEANTYIKLRNGSELVGKSADNPVSLLGEGLDFLIIDEAASIKREVWEEYLRPTLADRKGWALFISTPKGKNWFYEEYVRGKDRKVKHQDGWNYLTSDNPYIPREEIAHAEKYLPERVFLQEFQGKFIEDIGGVFRGVRECVGGRLEEPDPNRSYVMGVDLAKYQDYTVVIVMDKVNKQVVYFDRFHKLDWNFQKNKIANVIRRYNNCQCIIDATGIGDPIYDDLNRLGLNIVPYKISGTSKKPLIENLSLNIQDGLIKYPDIPELINELNIYAYKQNPATGHTSYSAPEGYHDDIVIALALACWAQKSEVIIDF